jgi:hypothetical protein
LGDFGKSVSRIRFEIIEELSSRISTTKGSSALASATLLETGISVQETTYCPLVYLIYVHYHKINASNPAQQGYSLAHKNISENPLYGYVLQF